MKERTFKTLGSLSMLQAQGALTINAGAVTLNGYLPSPGAAAVTIAAGTPVTGGKSARQSSSQALGFSLGVLGQVVR